MLDMILDLFPLLILLIVLPLIGFVCGYGVGESSAPSRAESTRKILHRVTKATEERPNYPEEERP